MTPILIKTSNLYKSKREGAGIRTRMVKSRDVFRRL